MDQQIGFASLGDRRVAYATVGSGRAIVLPPWWVSHVSEDWGTVRLRQFVEALARDRRVVRFDRVGTGASDGERPVGEFTLDVEVATLAAVVDALELDSFALLGISCGGCTAARYAAREPERVERLVLYGSYADGRRLGTVDVRLGMVDVVRASWGLGARVLTEIFMPGAEPAERAAFAAFQRSSAGRDTAARLLELIYGSDVTVDLTRVRAPTLVLHRRLDRAVPFRLGAEVAALLPAAEFGELEGEAHLPWHGDETSVIAASAAFLGIPAPLADEASGADRLGELSGREREVLQLVARGLTDPQIARELILSPHTVHRHVANIRSKLRLPSRAAAAAYAARSGLL